MESRAKLFGHPVHQMLVTFPIGAFGLSVVSDALHGLTGERKYAEASKLAIDFGLATSAAAAPFGWLDWFAIPRGTRAKRIGLLHAVTNVGMVGLFGVSRWLRASDEQPTAKVVSGAAFMLSGLGAWLGGELIDRHGIGTQLRGNDAESSLLLTDEPPTRRGIAPERSPQEVFRG